LGLHLFSSKVFVLSPLHFRVASFFIGGIYFNPLHFGVDSFFIGGLYFEPMNKGCYNAPLFVALAYLAYQLLSNTELGLLVISMMVANVLGNEAYIIALGLHGLHLVKNLMPSWASPVRKKYGL
jgi:hypothetical protein